MYRTQVESYEKAMEDYLKSEAENQHKKRRLEGLDIE